MSLTHSRPVDPPPTVRLMAPKPSAAGKPVNKSKGFAFLEFSEKSSLQQALKLHQSQLEGRMINVELTAGGGGKSETRLAKVRERNKELHGQRVSPVSTLLLAEVLTVYSEKEAGEGQAQEHGRRDERA